MVAVGSVDVLADHVQQLAHLGVGVHLIRPQIAHLSVCLTAQAEVVQSLLAGHPLRVDVEQVLPDDPPQAGLHAPPVDGDAEVAPGAAPNPSLRVLEGAEGGVVQRVGTAFRLASAPSGDDVLVDGLGEVPVTAATSTSFF